MDGLSAVASVVGIIQLTGNIVKICSGYLQEVKTAREDIIALQRSVAGLEEIFQNLKYILLGPRGKVLSNSSSLVNNINDCLLELSTLNKRIEPGGGQQMMKRLGFRAMKWPVKRPQVDRTIQNLEKYKTSLILSLEVDQSNLMIEVARTTAQIDQNMVLGKLPIARGAEFDSYMNQHEDECLLGTRTELLRQITEWARSPRSKCIYWLNGMAGTGKSTISRTVAKSLRKAQLLGASFFFKRGNWDRGNAMKLFPTMTRQLAARVPELVPGIQNALDEDPDTTSKSLKEQFDKLLLQPLMSLQSASSQSPTMVLVIDALDECERDEDIRIILQLLPQLRSANSLRILIFLTSRPELPIRLGLSKITSREHEDFVLHEIPEPVIEHDISLFLKHRLAAITTERSLPFGWPGVTAFNSLVKLSVPLFIFAATACRMFEDPHWDPNDSLTAVLAHQNDTSQLAGTYLPILEWILYKQSEKQKKRLIEEFQHVIGTIVLLEGPLTVTSLSRLVGLPKRVIYLRLNSLHSVLRVPDDETLPIELFHLSFRDFLLSPETRMKTQFWVDEKKTHYILATRCLSVCQNLRKNICGLPSDGTQRAQIGYQTIDRCLPAELQYSCRYWAHHLVRSKHPNAVKDSFLFLRKYFLYWIEAMSILGLASELVGIIRLLQTLLSVGNHSKMDEFLHDAKRFILKNRQIVDNAPLQLYCSGLVFTPQKAVIRRMFEDDFPDWIHRLPQDEETWSAELQTLEGHSGSVEAVSFSPNGQLLASCSQDMTIRLWNATTGVLQQAIQGHSSWVRSVALSPDGQSLASGSYDQTARIWDTKTGALQQILRGHSGSVQSVAYSPDGQFLASGSHDMTLRLWSTETGALQNTFVGHTGKVESVAFSPDGRILASGAQDKTVRLWNSATGAIQRTIQGHSDWVWSVSFSPNGRLLASSSDDKTARLWDPATGALQRSLEGHSSSVESVEFSPDGRLVASGSHDQTIRLWDTATGTLQRALEGHSGWFRSVAFSPDGWLLASGSDDETVRLWEFANTQEQTLKGDSESVESVAFSPDGLLLASGGQDGTVRLWNPITGALQRTLEGHLDWVWSVTFSPDGRLLASGSYDETVRLWDTATGTLRKTLKGHSDWVWSVAFSPDGQVLASSSDDKTVRLWETTTGALQRVLEGHADCVQSVAFSHDGRLVASGSHDKTVRLWDTMTNALQRILTGHSDSVKSLAFSPGGLLLASGSYDQTIRLWNTTTGNLQQTLRTEGAATRLEFSQDGCYLITNLGFIDTQLRGGIYKSILPKPTPEIVIWQKRWISLNGKHVLWLPPECRPSCSAIKENILALGHSSGRVSFLQFHV